MGGSMEAARVTWAAWVRSPDTGRSRMLGQFTFRLLIFSSYDTYGISLVDICQLASFCASFDIRDEFASSRCLLISDQLAEVASISSSDKTAGNHVAARSDIRLDLHEIKVLLSFPQMSRVLKKSFDALQDHLPSSHLYFVVGC